MAASLFGVDGPGSGLEEGEQVGVEGILEVADQPVGAPG
jgi:hypothetical protein